MTTKITDIIVPDQFTKYVVENTVEKTALFQSGALVRNAALEQQLQAGADSFTVPFWNDLGNDAADIANDDPVILSTPLKITAGKQLVRKSFLHNSWSAMNLASELSGDDALKRIQERVVSYWDREYQRRLIASLNGLLADNVANDDGDMLHDISTEQGDAAKFSAKAVIAAASTLGDQIDALTSMAVHSAIYRQILEADLIQYVPDSKGGLIRTYRGLAVVVDDGLPVTNGTYTTVLFGSGAFAFGAAAPRIADGTEIENLPSSGRGGGQQILHSRINLGIHPAGFTWKETVVIDLSPSTTELADATNWDRIVERKAIKLAFLKTK